MLNKIINNKKNKRDKIIINKLNMINKEMLFLIKKNNKKKFKFNIFKNNIKKKIIH